MAPSFSPASPYARKLFLAAAAHNLGAAAVIPYLVRNHPSLFAASPVPKSNLMFVDLFCEVVAILRIGYVLAALDLERYWPAVALGIAAKIGAVATVASYYARGQTSGLAMVLSGVDAPFAVLFYRALVDHAV